ncbi:MAG: enoyl-CoA hydratase-related protein [Bacteroidales bacterium]
MYNYIETQKQGFIANLYLARPEKRNAFHEQMIKELIDALTHFRKESEIKALVIRGKGPVFSAGADLDWMQAVRNYSFNENKLESKQLYRLFSMIYSFPVPVITLVHGASFGGANGIVAASDISLAETNTTFRFSEVQLGLLPATISPFVVRRIGEFYAREMFLTGLPFNADKAMRSGLVNYTGAYDVIENQLKELLYSIKSAASGSLKNTKWLVRKVSDNFNIEDMEDFTADMIASARVGDEGQEGMKAFAEKRKPDWTELSNKDN